MSRRKPEVGDRVVIDHPLGERVGEVVGLYSEQFAYVYDSEYSVTRLRDLCMYNAPWRPA